MKEDNKKKLNEQLFRCVLDDKLSIDKKLRKMEYIIRLGADINATHGTGYSLLSLAKMMKNDEIIHFFEEKKVSEIDFNRRKAFIFFKNASIDDISSFLRILPDGYVLNCNVNLSNRGLTELPDFSKINLKGYFDCSLNNLTTLKGAPQMVRNYFDCRHNNLTTLVGAPKEVNSFICENNQLTSLDGAPNEVSGWFACGFNRIATLKGGPKIVGCDFDCNDNMLTSLIGAPYKVGGTFNCLNNSLKDYIGKPTHIGGKFKGPSIQYINKTYETIDR